MVMRCTYVSDSLASGGVQANSQGDIVNKFALAATILLSFSTLAEPKTLVNDEWVIKPGVTKGEVISLGGDKPLRVIVEGLQDAKKGFTVRVLPEKVWNDYVAKKVTAKGLTDYVHGVQVMYRKTHKLEKGNWAVVVENSENMLKSISVRVKMIVDPKEDD